MSHQLTADEVLSSWPFPAADSDKYARGVVGFDTGSKRYPGAAMLGVTGALYAGAGMIRYFGQANPELILTRTPSVTIGPGRLDALVIGSGWDGYGHDRVRALISQAEFNQQPAAMVIDAGALEFLPELGAAGVQLPNNSLLTPHAGELAKLLDIDRSEVEQDPVSHAQRAAERHGCCVLVKGAKQYCATPAGEVLTAVPGLPWTGQAGSGDVLAGICGALLAAGLPAQLAGAYGASIQALAAVRKSGPFPPDVMAAVVAEILGEYAYRDHRAAR